MIFFQRFYLDREKDIVVELYMEGERLLHVIRTPNHHSGNLITNLARLCGLETSEDENGLKVIRGEVPCYYDGDNRRLYIPGKGVSLPLRVYQGGAIGVSLYRPEHRGHPRPGGGRLCRAHPP